MSPEPHDVVDAATGKVRVLKARCATCIFWRDGRSPIGEERTDEVIAANVRAGALLTCHSTLPYGSYRDFAPAVCAGFWAEHSGVPAGRIAERLIGVERVDPPAVGSS
jgi:hypothetical protein